MKLLQRLFNREATVETTERPTTADDVMQQLADAEEQKRRDQAARIARQRQRDAEYRARIERDAEELRGRLNASLDELGDLVPRLLLACGHFDTVSREVQEKGLGFTPGAQLLEDVFCLPPDFGARLVAAIYQMAPRTEWDFGHTGPFSTQAKGERPTLKDAPTIRLPRFSEGPPPGYSGVWPPEAYFR